MSGNTARPDHGPFPDCNVPGYLDDNCFGSMPLEDDMATQPAVIFEGVDGSEKRLSAERSTQYGPLSTSLAMSIRPPLHKSKRTPTLRETPSPLDTIFREKF